MEAHTTQNGSKVVYFSNGWEEWVKMTDPDWNVLYTKFDTKTRWIDKDEYDKYYK